MLIKWALLTVTKVVPLFSFFIKKWKSLGMHYLCTKSMNFSLVKVTLDLVPKPEPRTGYWTIQNRGTGKFWPLRTVPSLVRSNCSPTGEVFGPSCWTGAVSRFRKDFGKHFFKQFQSDSNLCSAPAKQNQSFEAIFSTHPSFLDINFHVVYYIVDCHVMSCRK